MKHLWLLPSFALLALAPNEPSPGAVPSADGQDGLVTLYARDDLRSSFSFRSGGRGASVRGGQVWLDRAQIVFGVFREDMLSFGFSQDDRVDVLDLGDLVVPPVPLARDGAPRFPISVYHTLFRDGPRFAHLDATGRAVRIREADRILNPPPPEGLYHVEPILGHVYVLRSLRTGRGGGDAVFKFQVVDHRPGLSVTFRWARVP